jgi:chemotaxis protein methyltransferase CheR
MNSSELRDVDYEKISRLVYEQCGINLHEGKKELVKARLGKRLREGNFQSFGDYYHHVVNKNGTDELINMIDSLSTNLTSFFREESHFHTLRQIIRNRFEARSKGGPSLKFRIWSAGCSTGEEPYSLAMAVCECVNPVSSDVKIQATDISTRVLSTAIKGIYRSDKISNMPPSILKKYFQIGSGESQGYYRIKKDIREMIQFERFNLMETPPSSYRFDVIFCRNVMIYFDKETQAALINRFYQCLNGDGYLFIGHSESLTGLKHEFKYVEPNIYRK